MALIPRGLETLAAPPARGRRLALLLATGFGLGYSPFAPGTVGSLWGVVFAAALAGRDWWVQLAAVGVGFLAAIPICHLGEDALGRKDDGRIVADEYLVFPLCLVGIPWWTRPEFLAVAFVVCRLLDIIKPPPARQAQGIHGGLGIALDDLISTAYALGLNTLLWMALQRWYWI